MKKKVASTGKKTNKNNRGVKKQAKAPVPKTNKQVREEKAKKEK